MVSLSVDRRSGELTRTGEAPLPGGPPYIKVDHSGRYLLAAYYGDAGVSVHAIGDDGNVGEQLQWLDTAEHAHSIQPDPSNRFVFVPHTNPANAIYQFRFDAESGRLTPNDPPKVQPATEEGPRHFIFHPSRDLLYSINENGCTVSAHRFDSNAGTLTSFQVVSTLPEGVAPSEEVKTAEIDMTPDGRFLIASNRGHNSLAVFAVAADGSLTFQACYPTEPVPRYFAIDPSGRWVLSAGSQTGCIAMFRLNGDTGVLEPAGKYEVGAGWIEFVEQE